MDDNDNDKFGQDLVVIGQNEMIDGTPLQMVDQKTFCVKLTQQERIVRKLNTGRSNQF